MVVRGRGPRLEGTHTGTTALNSPISAVYSPGEQELKLWVRRNRRQACPPTGPRHCWGCKVGAAFSSTYHSQRYHPRAVGTFSPRRGALARACWRRAPCACRTVRACRALLALSLGSRDNAARTPACTPSARGSLPAPALRSPRRSGRAA
eukprot:scaffold3208_cov402-Prasinococcus_capsulatus_cf.AAC.12